MRIFLFRVRRAIWQMLVNDGLLVGKAAAYSAIVSLFPGLLVLAALVAVLPGADSLRHQIYVAVLQVLPGNSAHLVGSYFIGDTVAHTLASILTSAAISFLAATGLLSSLTEGFRRAERVPREQYSWARQRVVTVLLVPLSLLPLALAAGLIIFGRIIAHALAEQVAASMRGFVLLLWLIVRWGVALGTSVAMLTTIYQFSLPHRRALRNIIPGACLATGLWFPITLAFGWYVTRFADYSAVYGSLGAGIATLAWLYIVCVAALIGAEYNAELSGCAVKPSVADHVAAASLQVE